MAFKRPNYTKFPNEVLDHIHELSGAEFKLIGIICRQTLGWGRERSRMSLTFLRRATGLSRQGLLNTIESLIKRDWIERIPEADSYVYGMKFEDGEVVNSVDYTQSTQLTPPVNSVDPPSQLSRLHPVNSVDPQVVNSVDPNKERSFKETFKESSLKKEAHVSCAAIAPSENPKISEPESEPIQPEIVAPLAGNAEASTQTEALEKADVPPRRRKGVRKNKNEPSYYEDPFERFWGQYRAFCVDVDASPGIRAEAVKDWDAFFESSPLENRPELLQQILDGTEYYCVMKRGEYLKKGQAIGISHGCRYLRNRKWAEALEHRDRKASMVMPGKADVRMYEMKQRWAKALEDF